MNTHSLENKVAIITGSASPLGTGHAMALAFIRAGARVALVDINQPWLTKTLDELHALGGRDCAIAIHADVTQYDQVAAGVARTIRELGGLHVVVNNAGTTPRAAGFEPPTRYFWDNPVEAWNRVVAVNMSGPFYLAHASIGHLMKQGWGRLIGVTTSVDTMFGRRRVPYGPSKAGHEALAASMAAELEGTGVTSNVLVPGGPTSTNFFTEKTAEQRAELIQPEIMQAPALWLASDASSAVNGLRVIALRWDESLPIEERLVRATAPCAWPQLGQQAVMPRRDEVRA